MTEPGMTKVIISVLVPDEYPWDAFQEMFGSFFVAASDMDADKTPVALLEDRMVVGQQASGKMLAMAIQFQQPNMQDIRRTSEALDRASQRIDGGHIE